MGESERVESRKMKLYLILLVAVCYILSDYAEAEQVSGQCLMISVRLARFNGRKAATVVIQAQRALKMEKKIDDKLKKSEMFSDYAKDIENVKEECTDNKDDLDEASASLKKCVGTLEEVCGEKLGNDDTKTVNDCKAAVKEFRTEYGSLVRMKP